MKKMTKAQIAIGMISMVAVYLFTCQLNSVKLNSKISTPEKMRVEQLQAQLTSEREKNTDLQTQLLDSQKSLETYRSEATNSGQVNEKVKEELDKANLLSGLTQVEGSGIVVTLTDSTKPAGEMNGNYEQYIIHDGDLRMVLTELFGAGAEAVSINEQRIVGTTAVRCVGNTIMVNDEKIAPPFEIKAIGNQNTLEAALMIKGGVADYLKSWNIELGIKKTEQVKIPRYNGVANFTYASAVQEKEASK